MLEYSLNDVWKLLLLKTERLQHIQIPMDFIIENVIFSWICLGVALVSFLTYYLLQGMNRNFCIHRAVNCHTRVEKCVHYIFSFSLFRLFYHYTKNYDMACLPDSPDTNFETNAISSY